MLYDAHVYVAIGQDSEHGEGVGMLSCINAAAKTMKEIGRVEFDSLIYATPVVANGMLYITTLNHVFACEQT